MKEVEQFLLMDFADFMDLSLQLCKAVLPSHRQRPFDYLISIQRGGAVMSKILSDVLEVPIATVTATSYVHLNKTRTPIITQDISTDISEKKVLVLDEISDTGETLTVLIKHLESHKPNIIETATLFIKPHTTFTPTYHVVETKQWIVFPYELKEMCVFINTKYADKPELVKEITAYLKRNGARDELLSVLHN